MNPKDVSPASQCTLAVLRPLRSMIDNSDFFKYVFRMTAALNEGASVGKEEYIAQNMGIRSLAFSSFGCCSDSR